MKGAYPKNPVILHIDMDSFFAAVEVREHPDLAGKPLVIGADPRDGKGRGVVCTCSYEARDYGIHSAMPISHAFCLCPHAIFLAPRYGLYIEASERIMGILRGYADRFQQVSIDEAFLDISTLGDFTLAGEISRQIKEDIFVNEHLTCSVGAGPGKTIAKIASDLQKPGGLVIIPPWRVEEILHPLPIRRIPGIGKKTDTALQQRGICTIGDLARADIQALMGVLGRGAVEIQNLARGIDDAEVIECSSSKSISRETTFDCDCEDAGQILLTLNEMIRSLCRDVEVSGLLARTITVKIRYLDFTTVTRARSFTCNTGDAMVIQRTARDLVLPLLSKKKVRLAGIRLSSLASVDNKQRTIGDFVS